MARTGRKVTTASLETKIEKQKEVLAKSKAKYEADKAEMLRLVKLRDSMQAEELMEAIAKSKYSIGDVIKMVKGKNKPVDEE
jgi:hypothetical protein